MSGVVLCARPQPDCDRDVAALSRRGVAALAGPVMKMRPIEAAISRDTDMPGGIVLTSRNALDGFLGAVGGVAPETWRARRVYAVGRATARAARLAGFRDIETGMGGGAGLVPLIVRDAPAMTGGLLWPCAVHRSFDVAAAVERHVAVEAVPVYEMLAMDALPAQVEGRLRAGDIAAVVLMSRRSAELLRGLVDEAGFAANRAAITVLAGSDAIARAAGGGWAEIITAKRASRSRLLAIATLLYYRRIVNG